MRIYLAGPMTGMKLCNRPAFDAAAAVLRAIGHAVDNPSEFDADDGFNFDVPNYTPAFLRNAMRRDCEAICKADAIALLTGWENSRGVAVELALAKYLGLAVLDATTGEPFAEKGRAA